MSAGGKQCASPWLQTLLVALGRSAERNEIELPAHADKASESVSVSSLLEHGERNNAPGFNLNAEEQQCEVAMKPSVNPVLRGEVGLFIILNL